MRPCASLAGAARRIPPVITRPTVIEFGPGHYEESLNLSTVGLLGMLEFDGGWLELRGTADGGITATVFETK